MFLWPNLLVLATSCSSLAIGRRFPCRPWYIFRCLLLFTAVSASWPPSRRLRLRLAIGRRFPCRPRYIFCCLLLFTAVSVSWPPSRRLRLRLMIGRRFPCRPRYIFRRLLLFTAFSVSWPPSRRLRLLLFEWKTHCFPSALPLYFDFHLLDANAMLCFGGDTSAALCNFRSFDFLPVHSCAICNRRSLWRALLCASR